LNGEGNTVSAVVYILQPPDEAIKMLCPEESSRLSMITPMITVQTKIECDDG
jgi:hypothetical protein